MHHTMLKSLAFRKGDLGNDFTVRNIKIYIWKYCFDGSASDEPGVEKRSQLGCSCQQQIRTASNMTINGRKWI